MYKKRPLIGPGMQVTRVVSPGANLPTSFPQLRYLAVLVLMRLTW